LNLPEKLNQKIYSRMGDAKIAFSTYDKNDMQKII
jgi:Cdc6-like AAA superfamily ATPase